MKQYGWIISKYLVKAVLPYFIFSWLLLSVVIFVQQASRFSEIFFSTSIPNNLIWQLTIALVPNVIAFTCPMAVLVGVIIGLSKLQGDSELTAIRAAGIGSFQISLPIIILGILLSIFAFTVNLKGVPFAAQIVRGVALKTALYKLESPIEPGVFNTELAGFTVYVKNGNIENGTWENIFIYQEESGNNQSRLITSKSGRIDSKDETSELVLENASVVTLPLNLNTEKNKFISENVGQIRFAVKTKRGELVEKITKSDKSLDELGLNELARFAKENEGKERTEAELLLQRRLILSITPLVFALLGTALVLRFNRGGKGFGVFLALVSLVGYYLVTLLGEQLARTGSINVLTASLIPLVISVSVISWLFWSNKSFLNNPFTNLTRHLSFNFRQDSATRVSRGNFWLDLTTGILDFDIVTNLLKYFFLTLGFLTSIFLIFTAFELWKFAGVIDGGVWLLAQYLFYLLPFIYIQISPSALMVAILATFVIKSRQNEIVTWTSAGLSVYRLLFPCFILMLAVGGLNFLMQEHIFPKANRTQDEIRGQIRGGGILAKKDNKIWTSNENKIYSFETADDSNKNQQKIKNLTIYEFSEDEIQIAAVYKIPEAVLSVNKIIISGKSEKIIWKNGKADLLKIESGELIDNINLFSNLSKKPNHLNISESKQRIESSKTEIERRNYEIAVEKKYTTLILPFVITLFTAPFALNLGRKSRVATIGYAIGIWLLFMGLTSAFEQMGVGGVISAKIAVWSPILFFSMLGVLLISKVKT